MLKHRLAPFALSLAIAGGAQAASLTPPNLVAASSLNDPDLLLVWPYAAGGPLEAMSWSVFKAQMAAGLTGAFLAPADNLSDLGNPTVARTNLGLGSAALINTGTSGGALCLLNSACSYSSIVTAPAYAANGTAGAGYLELGAQTALPSAPGVANVRLFADASGRLSWVGSAGFKSGLDANAITTNRNYAFPDASGTVCVQGANCGTTVSGAIKGNGTGTYAQAACADLADGGNGGCSIKAASGSLTPTLAYDTPGTSSFSYTQQSGAYACVGGVVSGWIFVAFTPTNGTASGNLEWNNLPYAMPNVTMAGTGRMTAFSSAVDLWTTGWTGLTAGTYFMGVQANNGLIAAFGTVSTGSASIINTSNSTTGAAKSIFASFSYPTRTGTC